MFIYTKLHLPVAESNSLIRWKSKTEYDIVHICALYDCFWLQKPQDTEYSDNYSQGQTYKVYLHDDGGEKVKAIKYYRDYTGEGLKESKDKIESAPCTMLVTTDYQKARRMADEFRAFGANVSIIEE